MQTAPGFIMGWHRIVGVATQYVLDGPGIQSWWGWDFPQPSSLGLVPTWPPLHWVPGFCPGLK